MTSAYIYDAVRTPRGRGRSDGALHEITALSLMVQTLAALRDRSGLDTSLVDDVILGCVTPVGEQGSDIARVAALLAGYDERTPGVQVNRFCASGLEACNMAAAKAAFGEARFVVAGGVESMSRVAMASDGGAMTVDPAFAFDRYYVPQGISADIIATKGKYSRHDVDAYAVESQKRAAVAWKENRFAGSIIPVRDQAGLLRLAHDEHMRPDSSVESLGTLKPAFVKTGQMGYDDVAMARYPELDAIDHVHHGGNSSGVVDGASAVLIGSKEAGEAAGLKPRARILGASSIGSDPTIMLTAPEGAARKVLARLKLQCSNIDLFEINEAFSAVVLHCVDALAIDPAKVNVNGGAIAMGHPLGATGGMLMGTLLDELERSDREIGLITMCVGAGMGTATVIQRL